MTNCTRFEEHQPYSGNNVINYVALYVSTESHIKYGKYQGKRTTNVLFVCTFAE